MYEMSLLSKVATATVLSIAVFTLAVLLLPYWYVLLTVAAVLIFTILLTIAGLAHAADILNGEQCSGKLTVVWAKLSIKLARKVYVLKGRIAGTLL